MTETAQEIEYATTVSRFTHYAGVVAGTAGLLACMAVLVAGGGFVFAGLLAIGGVTTAALLIAVAAAVRLLAIVASRDAGI